ncbi:MAG: bifunctional oligoribonuclease/PAP phosphatase NrnA [Defluviitaleaceae bacterium]|nr:bifunctional oligoribonuclease/PAP phosphatase NrnA [Defluviitaleaceae bacterium]
MPFSTKEAWNNITKNGENIVIATHYGPDGDAVGSCFALAFALKVAGFSPKVVLDDYNEKLNIVDGSEFIFKGDPREIPIDLLICLDCGDFARVAAPGDLFARATTTVNIDHHMGNGNFATHNYVDVTSPSTCQIIFELINPFVPLNKCIAAVLYMGMATDTGGFRYSSTTQKTMEIAGRLMTMGIDFTTIQQQTIYTRSRVENAIFSKALQNLVHMPSGLTYTTINQAEMAETGAEYSDLEGIAEHMLNIQGTKIAAFFNERPIRTKVSFRSKDFVVNEIAQQFGGGGHKYAAAASFESDFEEGVAKVIKVVENKLNV